MEVESAVEEVEEHQQTNQEEAGQESQLSQCEANAVSANNNTPGDTEPINQTETGEEVNLKSSKKNPDDTEVQPAVSQNGHLESQGDNCANDCEEQIDVVNSDHDENEVKSSEDNTAVVAVADKNDEPVENVAKPQDEDINEVQEQETTNENHEESRSKETDDQPVADQKESQNSEESESILEKVDEEQEVADINEKIPVDQDVEMEELETEDKETTETDNQQEEIKDADESQSIDSEGKDMCEENESNSEPMTAQLNNCEDQVDNVTEEAEDVSQNHQSSESVSVVLENVLEDEEKQTEGTKEVSQDHESSMPTTTLIENGKDEEKQTEGTKEISQDHESSMPKTTLIENGKDEENVVESTEEGSQDDQSSKPTSKSTENGEEEENTVQSIEEVSQDHITTPMENGETEGENILEDEVTNDGAVSGNEEKEACEENGTNAESIEKDEVESERQEEKMVPSNVSQIQGNFVEMEDEILSSESSQSETVCANNDKMENADSEESSTIQQETDHHNQRREEIAEDHDQLEENLECIVPPKEESDVSEQVLVDDEDMVVTQITSIEELEVSQGTNGHSQIIQSPKEEGGNNDAAANIDQFTEIEDLIIHALDTVSPFDAKFISDHMPGRDEQQIERRLTDHSFRKLSFTFQKLPFLMFEMIFVSESNERSSSLMLLTQKSLLQLKNKHGWCDTRYNLEVLELRYNSKTRFGIDVGALCEFIITNIPSIHMPYLRRNVREIEAFLEASNINYRKPNTKRDLKQLLNKVQQEVTMESLRVEGKSLIRIDEEGELHLSEEHEEMLRKIVANVGVNHWEEVTKLLLAVFEYEVDVDLDDDEIYDKIKCYYESKLDPNMASGFFTEEEDKCIIYMYKYWSKIMEDDQIWRQISQHLEGRSANQVKNRFLRTSQSPLDLNLENILKYPDDKTNPATFNSDLAHMFSLIIVQKNLPSDLEITSKLQQETRFLVLGTSKEMFVLPCKDTAIRPHHPGVVQHTFTYDPSRPPQQFVTFVKLTFGNGLKKLGLLEDPDSFNFNNIELHSPSIHQMMETADKERFIVPKDIFMLINRRMEAGQVVEFVLPVKRKYTRKVDRLDLHQRDEYQREKLKAKTFSPSPKKKMRR